MASADLGGLKRSSLLFTPGAEGGVGGNLERAGVPYASGDPTQLAAAMGRRRPGERGGLPPIGVVPPPSGGGAAALCAGAAASSRGSVHRRWCRPSNRAEAALRRPAGRRFLPRVGGAEDGHPEGIN
ncbi:MAG: hypothetical protein ACLVL7_09235 [Anaerotruncus massiliensis (ex Togo et al. 2019)]